MIAHDHPLTSLSFVDVESGSLFAITPTGEYAADCARGRQAASELIDHMRATVCPAALVHIAPAIGSDLQGVAVGFWTGIASEAL